jgi:hypothetical protein
VFVFYLISSVGSRYLLLVVELGFTFESCSRENPIMQFNFYIRHCYGIKKVTKKLFKLYVFET